MIYEITCSPTQGTKKVTDLIASPFPGEKEHIDLLSKTIDFSACSFSSDDICFIAAPAFGGRVPQLATAHLKEMKGNQAKAIIIAVYGNRAYEDTLIELKDAASEAGFHAIAAVSAIAEHSVIRKFAAGRPDANDTTILLEYGREICEKLSSGDDLPEITVPGNHPYKEMPSFPFKPTADERCNGCGICAKACPADAIDPQDLRGIKAELCISCLRCVAVCPSKVRGLGDEFIGGMTDKLAPLFAERKENELFI